MQIRKVGDTSKAVCESCKSLVQVTYGLHDVPFSDGSGVVSKVLAGACEQCGDVCVIPHQSTPMIKVALDKQKQSVEGRVPAHMVDILNLASAEVGCDTDFVPHMLKYYINALASEKMSNKHLSAYLESELAKGRAEKRISLKGRHIAQDLDFLGEVLQIDKRTDLLKGVILKINDDILQKKRAQPMNALRGIASAFA